MSETNHSVARPDDELRAALAPELEVLRTLGSGSTAHVYLAREIALQRLVAVKVLRPELSADPVLRKRFEREAQSAARISHPHVNSVHRIGRLPGDVPYMVIEYVDGRTLRDVIESRGPLAIEQAKPLLASIASALAAVHARGIVHRDVRPANVFVENRTGRAVLGDFGIAALIASGSMNATRLTTAGQRVGVTAYMSPEQSRGDPVTEQSDVYAFGVLAYDVLTGRGPYDARTDMQLLEAHLRRQPRPLRELRQSVDPALAALVEACLAKDPQRRPLAGELVNTLEPGRASSDAPAATGALDQFLRELRRRRVFQVLLGYGAVAAAALGLGEPIFDAFELSPAAYRTFVLVTLLGFPVALVLSWLFDIRRGRIERTRGEPVTSRSRALVWLGLALSIVAAAAVGWFVLRGR